MDPYNFKVRLQKAVERERYMNPYDFSADYADGMNKCLDLITEITGLQFHHIDDYIWPFG